MTHCVLLNADYTFLNVVNWKRALCMMAKGKVQVIRYSDRIICSGEGCTFKVPAVMKLVNLIRVLYRNRVPFSKKNVTIRDSFRCGYCGARQVKLSIDHIIPRSRGGETTFENCVSCCTECNSRKGDRTPSEAGMFLKFKTYQPTISEFLRLKCLKLGLLDFLRDIELL